MTNGNMLHTVLKHAKADPGYRHNTAHHYLPEHLTLHHVEDLHAPMRKSTGHKYLKRERRNGRWRYWYTLPNGGLVTSGSLVKGSRFKHGDGHYHIHDVHDDGHVTVSHTKTGKKERIHHDVLKDRVHGHHKEAIQAKRKKKLKDYQTAKKHSGKIAARRRKEYLTIKRGYGDKRENLSQHGFEAFWPNDIGQSWSEDELDLISRASEKAKTKNEVWQNIESFYHRDKITKTQYERMKQHLTFKPYEPPEMDNTDTPTVRKRTLEEKRRDAAKQAEADRQDQIKKSDRKFKRIPKQVKRYAQYLVDRKKHEDSGGYVDGTVLEIYKDDANAYGNFKFNGAKSNARLLDDYEKFIKKHNEFSLLREDKLHIVELRDTKTGKTVYGIKSGNMKGVYNVYKTKRKAKNVLKNTDPDMLKFWAESATGGVMEDYASGRYKVVDLDRDAGDEKADATDKAAERLAKQALKRQEHYRNMTLEQQFSVVKKMVGSGKPPDGKKFDELSKEELREFSSGVRWELTVDYGRASKGPIIDDPRYPALLAVNAALKEKRGVAPWQHTYEFFNRRQKISKESHKKRVAEALKAGKPVPEKVLAEYPDLRPKQADYTKLTDARLMAAIADPKQYERASHEFSRRYKDMMVHAANQITHNLQDAQDIAYKQMAKFIMQPGKFSTNKGTLKNLLYTATVNAAKNATTRGLKHIRENEIGIDDLTPGTQFEDTGHDPTPDHFGLNSAIKEAIAYLEKMGKVDKQTGKVHSYEIAKMMFLEGKEPEEVAMRLGMDVGSVKRNVRRQREKLRAFIEEHYPEFRRFFTLVKSLYPHGYGLVEFGFRVPQHPRRRAIAMRRKTIRK